MEPSIAPAHHKKKQLCGREWSETVTQKPPFPLVGIFQDVDLCSVIIF